MVFVSFETINITRTNLSQIFNQNLEKLELERRKKVKNPRSRTQQESISSSMKSKYFFAELSVVYGISLVDSFCLLGLYN